MELTLEQALQKGIAAHRAGKAQEADKYYSAILKAQPKHPDANHNKGVLAVGNGKVQEALTFFKAALEANTSIVQFWISYIDALIKLQRMDDAKAVFDQAKSKGAKGDVFDQIEEKIKASPNTFIGNKNITYPETTDPSQVQQKLLIELFKTRQFNKALESSRNLLQDYPDSLFLHNLCGTIYKELQQFDAAIEAYTQALLIKSDFADAHYNMGTAFHKKGKLHEAIKAYEATHSINSQHFKSFNNIGVALHELGDFERAIKAYQRAISIKPDYADAYNNLSVTLQGRGSLKGAIAALEKAISIKPNNIEALNNMGNVYKEQGDIGMAIEAYEKALIIEPKFAETFWNLLGTAKTLKDGQHWLQKCLNANPTHLKAKLTMSALNFYEGNKDEFFNLMQSPYKEHPYVRSFSWAFNLPKLPPLYFHRWALFDAMIEHSKKDRPFYEFGVWRGEAFKYLIKTFKKGYGFDTFQGLPEDWHDEKAGTYTSDGNIPKVSGGEFIVGKFEDTLPEFFQEKRPKASIINFDADLYSSTICALNYSKPVIDQHTILIFDEFIINDKWEEDEYRALEEFCAKNHYTYEVLAISFVTKQVAVRITGI